MERNPSQTLVTERRTQLFSFLALLNAYIPEAYLLMSECQKILGPPDPIHGGPPFEERMEPFIASIKTSSPRPGCVCMINQEVAQESVEELAISRSATVEKFMLSLCIDQTQPRILQYVKDLLTKRKCGVKGREKFSRLIEDIRKEEKFSNALSVLETASDKFKDNKIYPQTISRLYYTTRGTRDYGKAEEWAKESIKRAPNNSFVADTLGQIYKNRLMRVTTPPEDILHMAKEAFKAFKDVERKADKEEDPKMRDIAGTVSFSSIFNNRGLFGFIQVAKIALEKLNKVQCSSQRHSFIQRLEMEVEAKFDFFEWYLAYSKPAMTSVEPLYFWKDVVLCYELFTTKTAAESTSVPALLDCLNRGSFSSKGRRAGFEEAEETVSDLEAIQEDLKTAYEANVNDVKAAERYILSNIILSNKMRNSPKLTLVKELQRIIHRFLVAEERCRSPEFYLLVLLLFWPEEKPQELQEEDDEGEQSTENEDQNDEDSDEEQEQSTEDEDQDDKDSDEEQEQSTEDEDQDDEDNNEEQETRGEPAQQSVDFMFNLDLQKYVTFMEKAFEGARAKYLRGRYLLPLFFLGKGSGLSKWIHKSRLDAIIEEKADANLADEPYTQNKKKWGLINEMWINGDVWRVSEIQDILLPVRIDSTTMPQKHDEVFVCVGGKQIVATVEAEPDASTLSPMLFYLGFTIKGPVLYRC
ncbi:sterile alpha motif domain-containing protein 9-like [Sebastes umbrosus]|uniref:sterile alpha motif domain-containing protein 9-like n=1 Tax=Sebastes umbrosus TaxID=72105 RepID=UPI00189DF96A|nr:sterile alpha motif domain-containing protein 9-like [Sebastes umbrosus]